MSNQVIHPAKIFQAPSTLLQGKLFSLLVYEHIQSTFAIRWFYVIDFEGLFPPK